MRAALRRDPSRRFIAYHEAGGVVDTPHELVYDPNDHDVWKVIARYNASSPVVPPPNDTCGAVGKQIAPDFFDLTVECFQKWPPTSDIER